MTGGRRRALVVGIILLAAVARLWGLTEYPPGLYPDQAANGEDVLDILAGRPMVFSPRGNGREALFFYVQALSVALFGVGVWPMFLASAVVGILTVCFTYLAGARLFGHGPGLLAAFFLATNPWQVTLSRTGFRAVAAPLFLALALWLFARVFRASERPRSTDALLAGMATGLGVYTYLSFRAFWIFAALFVLVGLARAWVRPGFRPRLRTLARPVLLATSAAAVTAGPLFAFFARHPEFAGARAGHVSIFNPDLNQGSVARTFLRVTGRTLWAFVGEGDGNPRHNVPRPTVSYVPGGQHRYAGGGEPFLTPVAAAAALVGVVIAVRRAPWLIGLFLVMLLPAVLTAEGIPHGLRTAGTIPTHVLFAGLGAAWLWKRWRRFPWLGVRRGLLAVGVLLLGLSAARDLLLYFGQARSLPLAHYEYRADLTTVSRYLTEHFSAERAAPLPFLVLDAFSAQTVHFLTTPRGHPYRLVDPAVSADVSLRPGEQMIFTQSTLPDASRYLGRHAEVRIVEDRANRFNETVMLVLQPARALDRLPKSVTTDFGSL